jgi:hypothetical protein
MERYFAGSGLRHVQLTRDQNLRKNMIELNGKKFIANRDELKANPDSVGFYRVNRRTVSIQDLDRKKVGVITSRRVLACATQHNDGRWWYSHATIELIGEYESYRKENKEILAVLKRFNIKQN